MTTPHTITITHVLTDEFLQDIMTTAVESSYEWFNFRKVVRLPEGHEQALSITSFDVIECDGDNGIAEVSRTAIDAGRIAAALQAIMNGGRVHSGHVATIAQACAENDASNIDADLADCILQVACFDEIRYG